MSELDLSFRNLNNDKLEEVLKLAVLEENKAKTRVLHLLAEVERRRLYSKNYPSLFEYCVSVLKYSSASAQRRIDTMRAIKLIPEIESKLITGELNLSTVSIAQSFFRQEAKLNKTYSIEDKRSLLQQLENKSTKECIETFVSISPQSGTQEKRRDLTPDKTELKVVLSKELIQKLDRIKALLSNKKSGLTDSELIETLADLALQKLDPIKKVTSDAEVPMRQNTKSELRIGRKPTNQRYIPIHMKSLIWQRDKSQCTHKNCKSKYFLQIDHIKPLALGGTTTPENLRLLCSTHHRQITQEVFG